MLLHSHFVAHQYTGRTSLVKAMLLNPDWVGGSVRKPCFCAAFWDPSKQTRLQRIDAGQFLGWLGLEANGKSAAWLSGVLPSEESIVIERHGAPCQRPKRELLWTYHRSCNPFLRQPVQREQALLQGKEGMFQLKALLVQRLFGRDFEPGLYSTVVGRN